VSALACSPGRRIADLDVAAEHGDELEAMRAAHEAYMAELLAHRQRLAHALGLLDAAERLRVLRVEQLAAAEARLGDAISASVDALDAAEAAGQTVIDACRLVAQIRMARP
jgi:pantoate kinase